MEGGRALVLNSVQYRFGARGVKAPCACLGVFHERRRVRETRLDAAAASSEDFAISFNISTVPTISSRIDPGSDSFQAQRAGMLQLVQRLRDLEARAAATSAKSKPLFDKRGQLLPRERLARLLDPGSPWLELSSLAGYLVDHPDPERSVPGGGMISGIGTISGTRCVILVNDAGINAGAIQRMGGDKLLRGQAIAMENKLPYVQLIESAGANLLQYKVEGFVNGGRLFYNLARLSAAGIPVIGLVHGSSTAGGAYMPGLSDYVIMVRGRAKAFLAGPPLLKAATGEIANDEELGGAEMHTSVSGLGEYLAEDDADAVRIAREVMQRLQWGASGPPQPDRCRPGVWSPCTPATSWPA